MFQPFRKYTFKNDRTLARAPGATNTEPHHVACLTLVSLEEGTWPYFFILYICSSIYTSYQKIKEKSFLQLIIFYIFCTCFPKYYVREEGKRHLCTWLFHSPSLHFSAGEYARSRVRRWQLHRGPNPFPSSNASDWGRVSLCTTTMHVSGFWFAKIPWCFLVYNH
jgi:hypothetical protein